MQKIQDGRLPNFHEFWSEEVQCLTDPYKRKL